MTVAGTRFPIRTAALVAVLWLVPAVLPAQEGTGEQLYLKYCAQCHGDEGDGEGVAAPYLKPKPRDFTSGKYKVRTTPTGSVPTDDDIERAIRLGLSYSAMPAFPDFTDAEYDALVAYLKTFSSDFEDPEAAAPPIEIPQPPPYTDESVARGKEVYAETGCARCHGDLGRGDGMSAPTLVDDWGHHIRAADLSMPWTFRGGGTRQDVFRTMSTGFNGTPMPGFHGSLPVEDIWAITDYIVSFAGGPSDDGTPEAPYSNLLRSAGTDQELDLELGAELFANAPPATFPIVGQIIEPGRNFYPSATAVTVQAVHNEDDIAFRVTWHDMRAETSGLNAPDLQVPTWDQQLSEDGAGSGSEADDEGGFWGDEVEEDDEGGFWGDAEVDEEESGDDFWGEDAAGEDDFWGAGEPGAADAPAGADSEFSDAVAIQLPLQPAPGVRKPYFLFGDAQNPVDLWFVDLADPTGARYLGRGSQAITPAEGGDPIEVASSFDDGQWSVIMKRRRKGRGTIGFEEQGFVPIAFTVWDGFNRERGNKRGLTSWYNLYVSPLERPSPYGAMLRAGFGVLGIEILIILLVRRWSRRRRTATVPVGAVQQAG